MTSRAVKRLVFDTIARHRDHHVIRQLAEMANAYLAAYDNENWNPALNGEARVLVALPAGFVRTAFDVGASHGSWCAMLIGTQPQARIHCFEIVPTTAALLEQRFAGTQSVTVNAFGLGRAKTTTAVHLTRGNRQLSSTIARSDVDQSETITSTLMSGDAYMTEHAIESIDYLKVDVEGADLDVLLGLRDALTNGSVAVIQFEYSSLNRFSRTLLADFYELLDQRYVIGKIRPSRVEFAPYDSSLEDYQAPNCLAVRRDLAQIIDVVR